MDEDIKLLKGNSFKCLFIFTHAPQPTAEIIRLIRINVRLTSKEKIHEMPYFLVITIID